MHDELDRSGKNLGIYGNPYDGVNSYLRPELLPEYSRLFDQAEAVVAEDSVLLGRVRTARLPLEFAILELARRNLTPELSLFLVENGTIRVNPDMKQRLKRFVAGCKKVGIQRLHERDTSPEDYRAEMEEFFRTGFVHHLALQKPVRLAAPASPKYPVGGAAALTNGLRGAGDDYHCNWLGFEGVELSAIVDLGATLPVRHISAQFLQDVKSWVWMPRVVHFSISGDGKNFISMGSVATRTDERYGEPVTENFAVDFSPRKARFVKVATESFLACPEWHLGAGGKAWIFVDEIVVK